MFEGCLYEVSLYFLEYDEFRSDQPSEYEQESRVSQNPKVVLLLRSLKAVTTEIGLQRRIALV